MITSLIKLTESKDLLYMLTWRDIKIRYKQSVMGFLWAILMPALIVGAGALVRVAAAQYTGTKVTAADLATVMVKAVVWAYFVSTIRFGTNCLLGNAELVTKIAFPKEVFPLAAVLSSLFDFFIASGAILIGLVALGWHPTLMAFWSIPLLVVLVILSVGLTLILSAANLFYRDVKYLVEIFLTYAIFFTPVLYDASAVGDWQSLLLLNPIAPLLEALADVVVNDKFPNIGWTLYSTAFSLILLVFAYWFFKQLETKFAESI